MSIRMRLFAAGAALALTAIPSFAAGHGGGGHAGGGHAGGGHPGGGHPGGGGGHYSGGGIHYGGGIVLGFGVGGIGGGYGGSVYRPSYYGNGYSGGGYYGNAIPYSSGGGYYGPVPNIVSPPTTAYTYPNIVNNPAVNPTINPAAPTFPLGTVTGLKITDLYEGTAKSAGLRKGDIIVKVDGTRTQSFEELRATLSTGKDKVVVEYIDGTSGETEKRTVPVDGTKIGVSVSETAISK